MAKSQTTKPAKKPPKKKRQRPDTMPIVPPPPSPLRGLLPTPPEVEEIVERWCKKRPASPEARLRITEDLKMQYYFGGHDIVYRNTPAGKEVLAVGPEETRRLLRELPEDKHQGLIFGHASPPW